MHDLFSSSPPSRPSNPAVSPGPRPPAPGPSPAPPGQLADYPSASWRPARPPLKAGRRSVVTPASAWPDAGDMLAGDVIQKYLEHRVAAGKRTRTLQSDRQAGWSILRFLQANAPLRELSAELPQQWFAGLCNSDAVQARPCSLPKDFSRANVQRFFDLERTSPPKLIAGHAQRSEWTLNRSWAHGAPIWRWLGLETWLEPGERPRLGLPDPLVPTIDMIAAYWRGVLGSTAIAPARRRRIVETQAVLLLTGMRITEAILASEEFLEGSFLLLPAEITKPKQPRMICLNGQALALTLALRGQLTFGFAAPKQRRLLGWPWTPQTFQDWVERTGVARPAEKIQQTMRQRCSSWLRKEDADAERIQLGHGGGDVITRHYLDTLRELPAIMSQWRLPELDVPGFAWPVAIQADPAVPPNLYERFRRMFSCRQRRAA